VFDAFTKNETKKNNPQFLDHAYFHFCGRMFSDSTVNDKNSLTEIFTGPLVGPKVSFD
jgi:hypothetical protein